METLRAACQRLLAELAVDLHASYALVERDAGGRDASSIPHRRDRGLRPRSSGRPLRLRLYTGFATGHYHRLR